ncbi:MAG: sulfatase-like hydrolase/transferase, partial [Melioribacteraceae bacterium]|nr:sulfatase-like hydrolase/transferase [Melioribacteraceae bacterium]
MKKIFNEINICKLILILLFPILFNNCVVQKETRPNIILVLTDDQGYGDLGVHGNEIINTPNIDKFAKASIQLSQFYVSPVCSPTRASLMTGRYNFRARVVDTYKGRSMIDPD